MLSYLRRFTLLVLTLLILPVLAALALTLLFFNLVYVVTRFTRRPAPPSTGPVSGVVTIVVLNWNGKDLLAQGLPSILEAVRADGRPHEVLVVDNGSTDGSVESVRTNFPTVKVLDLPENVGFATGNNLGVMAAAHDVVVLLNNDMVVDPGFLRPLVEGFGPSTFAVSSQILLQDPEARREETGMTSARFRRGMIDFEHKSIDMRPLSRPYYPVLWAGGGSSAFHRRRFLDLGGFQGVFSPAYVEDTDLSYQAWKVGWEVLFAPASVVHHKHRASTARRFRPLELDSLILRNQMFHLWKNLDGWRYVLSHSLFLPWNCYRLARDRGLGIWRGVAGAILRLPQVETAKLGFMFRPKRTDAEVFELCAKPGLFFASRRQAGDTQALADGRPRALWMTAYLPHLGRHAGAGRMFQFLKRMSSSYRITLLSFLECDEERDHLPEVEALCEKVVAMRRSPPARWQFFAYEPFDEFHTAEMQAAMDQALEETDFDLIQLEYSQMGCYADRAYGIPTVLTKHEVDFAACARRVRHESGPFRKLRWFYNYLQVLDREVSLLRRIDSIVCMTDRDAEELHRFFTKSPAHVINTGVDLDYFRPPEARTTEPRMAFVGAFQHVPNVDAMTYFCSEILPLVRAQVPEVKLTVIGSGPPPAIISLGEIPGVEVTGRVPDIRPFMARSSVYVVPLRLGVGIRGKILEAWGMALPVVATPVACAGLRCEHDRNLLIAETPRQFAAHVAALLRDPALRERLGREGRRIAEEHYGWDAAAVKLASLCRSLIRDGASRRGAKS